MGRFRESEPVETPPHQAEFWFSLGVCCPPPANGAREVALLGNRRKCQRRHTSKTVTRLSWRAINKTSLKLVY
jgi:hypothetical protein